MPFVVLCERKECFHSIIHLSQLKTMLKVISLIMAAYFQTSPLWGQEGVVDDAFTDGKTEKGGLRQAGPVSWDVSQR